MSNTRIIARNTGWYGIENVVGAVVTLLTSIAIARTDGRGNSTRCGQCQEENGHEDQCCHSGIQRSIFSASLP